MNDLKHSYRKNKQKILPIIFGLVGFFVIFRIILPQWTDIQDVQQLISTKLSTVSAKDSNVTLLNSMPNETVDSNYNLVATALPIQKDVVLIFSELNNVSAKTNVKLGGFSLQVGGIYSNNKTAALSGGKTQGISGIPYLTILINVSGDNDNLKQFAEELYKSIPLVEIKDINISKNNAQYNVNFFFKQVALRPANVNTTQLKSLSADENSLLTKLKSWQGESSILSQ